MAYARKIYIESETINKANENLQDAIKASREAIENGTSEDIKSSIHDVIEKSQNLRAFLCANYNIKYR